MLKTYFFICIFLCTGRIFATDIDLSDIQNVLSKDPASVEEFLIHLPEKYKERYSLQKQGRGLQDASLKYPRAIIFGKTAKTIMTFNGHPSQKKFNEIEIMTYDDLLKKYEFRVVSFQNSKATLSEKNPSVCMKCHLDARPLWDDYPNWKGMYGEENDRMTDEELANLRSEEYKSNPRYAALPVHARLTTPPLDRLRPRFNAIMGIYMKYRWAVSGAELLKKSESFDKIPEGSVFAALACFDSLAVAANGNGEIIFSERMGSYLKKQLAIAERLHPHDFKEFMTSYNKIKSEEKKFFFVGHFILQGKNLLESNRSLTSISPEDRITDSHTGTMFVGDVLLANLVPYLPKYQHLTSELTTYCGKLNCGSGTTQKDYDKITKFLKDETLEKYCNDWIDSSNIY